MSFTVVDFAERPDLQRVGGALIAAAWPRFMQEDAVANRLWGKLYSEFPRFQFVLLREGTDELVAVGNSVPLALEGGADALSPEGWDWAMTKAFDDAEQGRKPNVQCAISVSIAPSAQGQGISTRAIETMRSIGRVHGLGALFAPVRPMHKSRYPLTPMERFISWQDDAGLPFDGWLRVHARLGASIVGVCPHSMHISGSVADWEGWTKMRFPETGDYVVPHALVPVHIDREVDLGTYVEPNVWMRHAL